MSALTVLYDACILYPAPLRDLLMHLALTNLYRAKWSAQIHAEWMRNLSENRPDLTREQLERTRSLMDAHVRDALVEGYEPLIPTLTLPDSDDRHVLAAAITAQADIILTFNLKDFPQSALNPYGVIALHPDRFVCDLIDSVPNTVLTAIKRHRASLKHPPKSVAEYLEVMEQQGLPEMVTKLRGFTERI